MNPGETRVMYEIGERPFEHKEWHSIKVASHLIEEGDLAFVAELCAENAEEKYYTDEEWNVGGIRYVTLYISEKKAGNAEITPIGTYEVKKVAIGLSAMKDGKWQKSDLVEVYETEIMRP